MSSAFYLVTIAVKIMYLDGKFYFQNAYLAAYSRKEADAILSFSCSSGIKEFTLGKRDRPRIRPNLVPIFE